MSAPPNPPTLAIFLKAPRPGRVKTRLRSALGENPAAELYAAFLADTVNLARKAVVRQLLLVHEGLRPDGDALEQLSDVVRESVARATGEMDVDWLAQEEGDLGHRLSAAAVALDRRGALPALIIGSDAPDLPIGHLQTALDLLRLPPPGSPDLVLGPTQDGGVWCIGLGETPAAEVLREGIPWSTPHVQQSLGNRAHELGLKLMLAPPWYDVDEPADLTSLASRLRSGTSQATITTNWLRLRGLL